MMASSNDTDEEPTYRFRVRKRTAYVEEKDSDYVCPNSSSEDSDEDAFCVAEDTQNVPGKKSTAPVTPLNKKNEYMRKYREKMSPEDKLHYKAKAKERAKRWRQGIQNIGDQQTSSEKRKRWRLQKREQRKNMTTEQKNKVMDQRRERYVRKLMSMGKLPKKQDMPITIPTTPTKYADLIEKLIQDATPRKKIILKRRGLLRDKERDKEREMAKQTLKKIQRRFHALRNSRKNKDRAEMKMLVHLMKPKKKKAISLIRKNLKVRWATWNRYSSLTWKRKQRSDKIPHCSKHQIQEFYVRNAVILPYKKTVTKTGQKGILNKCTRVLHKEFSQLLDTPQIALSTFRKLRPHNLLTVDNHKFNQCLCEYCLNIENKIQAIKAVAQRQGTTVSICNKYDISTKSLCPPVTEHSDFDAKCVERSCQTCGTHLLREELLSNLDGNSKVSWKVWENATIPVQNGTKSKEDTEMKGSSSPQSSTSCGTLEGSSEVDNVDAMPKVTPVQKGKMGKKDKVKWSSPPQLSSTSCNTDKGSAESAQVDKKNSASDPATKGQIDKPKAKPKVIIKKVLNNKDSSVEELVNMLCADAESFTEHLFNAKWQLEQMHILQDTSPPNILFSIEDFAENYRTKNQDEPQSAHFNYKQVTVFPMVSQYLCPCGEVVTESAVFLSDDLTHDAYMVNAFERHYKQYLNDRDIEFDLHIVFSDGCAKEFKSKKPFYFVCQEKMERAYFGSRHGKSACDGLGGLVKSGATRAVATRDITIQNAEDMLNYGTGYLTKKIECSGSSKNHKSRIFFLIGSIDRSAPLPPLNALPGTQKMMNVKAGENGQIMYRKRVCVCQPCLTGNCAKCKNLEYTGEWKSHQLINDGSKKKAVQKETASKGKRKLCTAPEPRKASRRSEESKAAKAEQQSPNTRSSKQQQFCH
jgi:hypothetical protein